MAARIETVPTTSHLSLAQRERLRRLLVDEHSAQHTRAVELEDPVGLEPDLAEVLLARCRQAMEEIDAALSRIGLGSYGICVACGSAIPYERLEFVPAADRCVDCQVDRDRTTR